MSSSINIPTATSSGTARSGNKPHHRHHLRSMDATMGSPGTPTSSEMTPSSSSTSSTSSSAASPASSSMYSATPSRISKSNKGKGVALQSAPAPPTVMEQRMQSHYRRPSLLEIFIPSYVDCDYTPLENRREPIHEIFLSDEEIEQMFPK
ncbi:MAG: hypothetical protein STHCBS139747_006507 [Sporothrix thermara]